MNHYTVDYWACGVERTNFMNDNNKEHHQQGSLHGLTVEKNIGLIVPDEEKHNHYSSIELFLLSVAACYHDAGKSEDFKENHASVRHYPKIQLCLN